ncbi:MAG: hypothetical protein IJT85_03045 [Ruminococcus sp.]|nr:hypothetical protein [Ruminococcus sp.]
MKEKYDRAEFTVTEFDEEDVITTSKIDRNNKYWNISEFDNGNSRAVPGL